MAPDFGAKADRATIPAVDLRYACLDEFEQRVLEARSTHIGSRPSMALKAPGGAAL